MIGRFTKLAEGVGFFSETVTFLKIRVPYFTKIFSVKNCRMITTLLKFTFI